MSTLNMAASSGRLPFEDWENDAVVEGNWEFERGNYGKPKSNIEAGYFIPNFFPTCFHAKFEAFPSKRQGLTQGLSATMIP